MANTSIFPMKNTVKEETEMAKEVALSPARLLCEAETKLKKRRKRFLLK